MDTKVIKLESNKEELKNNVKQAVEPFIEPLVEFMFYDIDLPDCELDIKNDNGIKKMGIIHSPTGNIIFAHRSEDELLKAISCYSSGMNKAWHYKAYGFAGEDIISLSPEIHIELPNLDKVVEDVRNLGYEIVSSDKENHTIHLRKKGNKFNFSDVEKINEICEYKVSDFETSFNSDDDCMDITLKLDIDHTIEPIREYAKFNKRAGTISITATTSLIDEAMDMFKEDLMLDDEDNEDEEFEEDDDEDFFDLDKTELEIYHSFDITKYISKERLMEIAFNNEFIKNDILKVMKQIIEKYYTEHANEYYDNRKK